MRQKGFPLYYFEGYALDRGRFEAIKQRVHRLAVKEPETEEARFKTLVNAYLMGIKDAVELIGEKYAICPLDELDEKESTSSAAPGATISPGPDQEH